MGGFNCPFIVCNLALHGVVLGPTTPTSLGSLWEMQNLSPHPQTCKIRICILTRRHACTIQIEGYTVPESFQILLTLLPAPWQRGAFCYSSSPGPLNRHVSLVLEEYQVGIAPTLGQLLKEDMSKSLFTSKRPFASSEVGPCGISSLFLVINSLQIKDIWVRDLAGAT